MFSLSSIRFKVIIAIVGFLLLFFMVELVISQVVFIRGFEDVEKTDMIGEIQRVEGLLNDQVSNYTSKISDWSIWDDSYSFVKKPSDEFIEQNLQDNTFTNLKLNFMVYIATSGAIVYEKDVDLQKGQEVPFPKELRELLSKPSPITKHNKIDDSTQGIVRLNASTIFIFASRPIVTSKNEGPIAGTLVFGRYFDNELIDYLSNLNRTKIKISPTGSYPEDEFRIAEQNLVNNKYFVYPVGPTEIAGFTTVKDYSGKPAFILENEFGRPIYNKGADTILYFLEIFALVAFLSLILALFIVNRFFLSGITHLNENVDRIKDPSDPTMRIPIEGEDEYSNLAVNINKMLDAISSSQADLEKFKLAIENASDHIIITDPDGKIVFANKGAENLTGYSQEEIIGSNPSLWGKQMPKSFYDKLWDTIKNKKQPFHAQITNKRKNGELYDVELTASPILDSSGKVQFFVGVEHDISAERKLQENLLRENEKIAQKVLEQTKEINDEKARFLASINSMSLGFMMFDEQGKTLFINPLINKLTGINAKFSDIDSTDILLGKEFALKEKFDKCIREKQPVDVKEVNFNNKFFHLFAAPIFATDNSLSVIGVVVLMEDETEARVLDRSKDEFFSIASHELRTPLTAIRGNTALIKQYYQDKLQDKDLQEMIDDIHSASVRLIQIVNDFLSVSRLEQGRMEFKKENVYLPDLIKEKITEINNLAFDKGIKIVLEETGAKIPDVLADRDKLGEVILNLLGNAIKFTDKGIITVQIFPTDGFVKVSVTDTGRGIDEKEKSLLFRKFQQAGESILTRDTTQGTGLGLYISRLIIEQMGGEIHLESSEKDKGSVFSFFLPVAKNNI